MRAALRVRGGRGKPPPFMAKAEAAEDVRLVLAFLDSCREAGIKLGLDVRAVGGNPRLLKREPETVETATEEAIVANPWYDDDDD